MGSPRSKGLPAATGLNPWLWGQIDHLAIKLSKRRDIHYQGTRPNLIFPVGSEAAHPRTLQGLEGKGNRTCTVAEARERKFRIMAEIIPSPVSPGGRRGKKIFPVRNMVSDKIRQAGKRRIQMASG